MPTAADGDSSLAFTFDALNRLKTAGTVTGGIQPVVTLTNIYNAVGDRIRLEDSLGGVTQFDYELR